MIWVEKSTFGELVGDPGAGFSADEVLADEAGLVPAFKRPHP